MTTISLQNNESFHLSYMHYDESQYDFLYKQKALDLLKKIAQHHHFFSLSLKAELDSFLSNPDSVPFDDINRLFSVIASNSNHCRERVRFAVQRNPSTNSLSYVMWEGGAPNVFVQDFPIASKCICDLMPMVMEMVNNDTILANGLRAIHYLSSTLGEVIVTLIYDCPISGGGWIDQASALRGQLLDKLATIIPATTINPTKLSIIGRSRNQKEVLGSNFVVEQLCLSQAGRVLRYQQVDDGFSNPNAIVNMKALDWICMVVKEEIMLKQGQGHSSSMHDLLEMYCGNGNHTVALAAYFRKILAVEINKSLCEAAKENLIMNGIENVTIVACDSCKFANRILQQKKKLNPETSTNNNSNSNSSSSAAGVAEQEEYNFDTVLVDPPRAGLDDVTIKAVQQYQHIIYISCNPVRLIENMQQLCEKFEIVRMATFDHFAYTNHLEMGVLLRRKEMVME